jgi:hypothetical protein
MNDNHNSKKARRQIPAETKLQILKEARSANLLAEREAKLRAAVERRRQYWEEHGH